MSPVALGGRGQTAPPAPCPDPQSMRHHPAFPVTRRWLRCEASQAPSTTKTQPRRALENRAGPLVRWDVSPQARGFVSPS